MHALCVSLPSWGSHADPGEPVCGFSAKMLFCVGDPCVSLINLSFVCTIHVSSFERETVSRVTLVRHARCAVRHYDVLCTSKRHVCR